MELAGIPVLVTLVLLPAHACVGSALVHPFAVDDDRLRADGAAMVVVALFPGVSRTCRNPGESVVPGALPKHCPQG